MRKSLRFSTACLIGALFSISVYAQTVTIRGTVRNSTSNESVPAVSVIIKGSSEGTFTDDKGNFSITTTSKLPLTLVFSSVGFEAKEVNVSGDAAEITVDFTPVSTLGQEVVLAANRTPQRILESPVTIERLGGAALRNSPLPNYYEAIANLKGVDMHTASMTFRTVTTRGFVSSGNTRLNQLIDGMDNQAPGLNFSVGNIIGLTELDVDNIEILSGASSALYGSGGMNGTVLISSKNPFKYQGLSYNIKQGINHIDGKQRSASPYYDWTFRWAKNFNNKFAFKITGQLLKANDWQADDYRNVQRTSVLSKLVGGNRVSDPNYDGVNVYGDETSANMLSVAQTVQSTYVAGIAAVSGGMVPNIVQTLNGIIPSNSSYANAIGILNSTFVGPLAPLLPTVRDQLFPFYWGLRNNWVPNQNVSRTGYEEKYLVDYNTMNYKATIGLHYKITPAIEASWNSYLGTGTTVYTGADRYSLRNFKMAQHKLEIKHNNWYVRGYTTQENAGEAYNATVLGRLMQEAFRPSTTWYPTYIGNFIGYKVNLYNSGTVPSDYNAHLFARSQADAGRPLPGTTAFENLKKTIRTTAIPQGAKFLDRSDLWVVDGMVNLSEALNFTETVEIITGAQWKQWVMNSQGTIFADSTGPIKVNETGIYMQMKKALFDEFLTLTGAIRYDKQTNFDGRWTPRFTALMKVAKDHNVRLSFQTAYRFPSNQDQYINLNVGSGILIGCLPEFQTFYNLGSNPGYTAESVAAYRAGGNPGNTSILVPAVFQPVSPESVSSGEIGYKGIFNKKFLVDVYAYYSRYENFLARVAVAQSMTGSPSGVYNPFTSRNLSYQQTSASEVKAVGWGIGIEYLLPRGFILSGNLFSDQLRDLQPGLISFFNAPEYRWNLGLRNDNVWKNIGFNVLVKWQDNNYYEGTFVTGTLPYFTWVDAQVTYRMPDTKSVFRIGGSNVGNNYYRTGFGSPFVGGLYYVSYGYNIF